VSESETETDEDESERDDDESDESSGDEDDESEQGHDDSAKRIPSAKKPVSGISPKQKAVPEKGNTGGKGSLFNLSFQAEFIRDIRIGKGSKDAGEIRSRANCHAKKAWSTTGREGRGGDTQSAGRAKT